MLFVIDGMDIFGNLCAPKHQFAHVLPQAVAGTHLPADRRKPSGDRVRQRVIATLGRLDELAGQRATRSTAALGRGRFVQQAMVLNAARTGEVPAITVRRIGPALLFEQLWAETGCQSVITALARHRGHRFGLERTGVPHRAAPLGLMRGGSDLAADPPWREEYRIAGSEDLGLHHLYRAMAWLREELPADQQDGATRFAPRCSKDLIEEHLFAHRRDLFSRLDLVFMDTTSLYSRAWAANQSDNTATARTIGLTCVR